MSVQVPQEYEDVKNLLINWGLDDYVATFIGKLNKSLLLYIKPRLL